MITQKIQEHIRKTGEKMKANKIMQKKYIKIAVTERQD